MLKNLAAALGGIAGAVAIAALGAVQQALTGASAGIDMASTEGVIIALVLGLAIKGVNLLVSKFGFPATRD